MANGEAGKASKQECYRCGGKHDASKCKFKEAECHWCHKRGHIRKKCRSRIQATQESAQVSKPRAAQSNFLEASENGEQEYVDMFTLNNLKDTSPMCVNLHINHEELNFEVDTGAAMTVMSERSSRQTRTLLSL